MATKKWFVGKTVCIRTRKGIACGNSVFGSRDAAYEDLKVVERRKGKFKLSDNSWWEWQNYRYVETENPRKVNTNVNLS